MMSIMTKPDSSQPVTESPVYLFDDWFDPIEAQVRERVRGFIQALIALLLMDDDHIRRYLKEANSLGTAINTDDNALLEYAVPHEFLHRTQTIIRALKPYAGWDPTRLTGASKSDMELIAMYSAKRLSSIIEELSLPVE